MKTHNTRIHEPIVIKLVPTDKNSSILFINKEEVCEFINYPMSNELLKAIDSYLFEQFKDRTNTVVGS